MPIEYLLSNDLKTGLILTFADRSRHLLTLNRHDQTGKRKNRISFSSRCLPLSEQGSAFAVRDHIVIHHEIIEMNNGVFCE